MPTARNVFISLLSYPLICLFYWAAFHDCHYHSTQAPAYIVSLTCSLTKIECYIKTQGHLTTALQASLWAYQLMCRLCILQGQQHFHFLGFTWESDWMGITAKFHNSQSIERNVCFMAIHKGKGEKKWGCFFFLNRVAKTSCIVSDVQKCAHSIPTPSNLSWPFGHWENFSHLFISYFNN